MAVYNPRIFISAFLGTSIATIQYSCVLDVQFEKGLVDDCREWRRSAPVHSEVGCTTKGVRSALNGTL